MDIKEVGTYAGDVWNFLLKNDEVALSKLPKMIGESGSITYQALGWLAREGKIKYRLEGRTVFISSIK